MGAALPAPAADVAVILGRPVVIADAVAVCVAPGQLVSVDRVMHRMVWISPDAFGFLSERSLVTDELVDGLAAWLVALEAAGVTDPMWITL